MRAHIPSRSGYWASRSAIVGSSSGGGTSAGAGAGAHEVAVQRVDLPGRIDRAPGSHQRLPGDLAPEHPLRTDHRADAPKRRLVEPCQVEHLDQRVHGCLSGHRERRHQTASASEPRRCTRNVLVEPGVPGGLPATITTSSPRRAPLMPISAWSTWRNMSSVCSTKGTRNVSTPHDTVSWLRT